MEWWLIALFKIFIINLVLSGDNAIVIALASRHLPENKRKIAIFWGAFGAIALRVILIIVAIQLLQIPYLMGVGAVLLLWIALKLLAEQQEEKHVAAPKHIGKVVMTIILADFVMSLDNVIAIAAVAKGDLFLITLGLIISIPIIIWGSTLFLKVIDRFPIFIYIGSAILGFTAGEMLLEDRMVSAVILNVWTYPEWLIPTTLAFAVIVLGKVYQHLLSTKKAFH